MKLSFMMVGTGIFCVTLMGTAAYGADQNSNPRAPFDGRVMRWGNYPEWSPGHAEDQVCQNVTGLSAAFFALPARPEIHGSPPTGNRRRSVADCPQFTPGNT